jgi:hypothetical protein
MRSIYTYVVYESARRPPSGGGERLKLDIMYVMLLDHVFVQPWSNWVMAGKKITILARVLRQGILFEHQEKSWGDNVCVSHKEELLAAINKIGQK